MILADIGNALKSVTTNCHHYKAHKQTNRYIVWAEDGQANAGYGDNKMTTQVITGTVDYFTREEYDDNFDKIQSALNSLNIGWQLNSIQFEDDTGFIHYEWVWEGVFSVGENGD
jgi:hypothetical protein